MTIKTLRQNNSNEEHTAKVARLIKQAIIVAICVAFLGGLWIKYKYKARAVEQKRNLELRTELREDALSEFVNNPTLFDAYAFKANIKEISKPIDVSATVSSVDLPDVLFSFYVGGNYLGIGNVTLDQLNALRNADTINVPIGEVEVVITEIRSYERNDGPNLKPYSVGRSNITLIKNGGNVTLLCIENITGTAKATSELPYELRDDRISFNITKEGDVAEFRINGKSDISDDWSRRIVIHGWKSYVFPQ